MGDDDLRDLTNARKILIEMRHHWAKAIAAGDPREETETAIKGIIEVQQALEVLEVAIEDLKEEELEEIEEE